MLFRLAIFNFPAGTPPPPLKNGGIAALSKEGGDGKAQLFRSAKVC